MQNGKRKSFECHQVPLQYRVNEWWARVEELVGRETCRTMEREDKARE